MITALIGMIFFAAFIALRAGELAGFVLSIFQKKDHSPPPSLPVVASALIRDDVPLRRPFGSRRRIEVRDEPGHERAAEGSGDPRAEDGLARVVRQPVGREARETIRKEEADAARQILALGFCSGVSLSAKSW